MGSKSTFGVLLVILGLGGVWLLITGRLSAIVKSFATQSSSSASSTPLAANVVGGNSAPLGGTVVSGTTAALSGVPTLNLGSSALAYGVVVGDGTAHIEPIGGATLSG